MLESISIFPVFHLSWFFVLSNFIFKANIAKALGIFCEKFLHFPFISNSFWPTTISYLSRTTWQIKTLPRLKFKSGPYGNWGRNVRKGACIIYHTQVYAILIIYLHHLSYSYSGVYNIYHIISSFIICIKSAKWKWCC